MGYDMYWRSPREDDNDGLPAAQAAFNAAVRERDSWPRGSSQAAEAQKSVEAAYAAMSAAERTCFRLNISGMSRARELMAERGMLCEPDSIGHHEWPEYVGDGEPGRAEYERAEYELLSAHRGECPGIPAHKLSSNDGWHVLAAEITAALRANEKHQPPADCEWWDDWIAWIRDAVDRNGFEVH
jgi:hypothetical protein